MDDVLRSNGAWSLQKNRADLYCGSLAGQVDVSRPESGLNRLSIANRPLSGHILAVRPASIAEQEAQHLSHRDRNAADWTLAESYVRGCDLVATYGPRDTWPYTTQIYWSAPNRETSDQLLGALSLFVSLNTHLLDTWPKLNIDSFVEADEVLYLTDNAGHHTDLRSVGRGEHTLQPSGKSCCLLRRLVDMPASYGEIMPASDFRELTLRYISDGACQASWEIFGDFLEKGVIRRARLRSVVVPRQNDVEIAEILCREIDQQRLPLTT